MNPHLRATRAWTQFTDLVWPRSCAGCGAWGPALCDLCRLVVGAARPRIVRPVLAPHLEVHVSASFEGPVRKAVTTFKDEGRRDVRADLGALLRDAVARALARSTRQGRPVVGWAVVTVPSSAGAYRRRGRVPLGELGERITGPGVVRGPRLVATRRLADQSSLGRRERAANVRGAFVLGRAQSVPAGYGIVLVDDVVTTGATLAAAAAALRHHSTAPVAVAAIAATPPVNGHARPGESQCAAP